MVCIWMASWAIRGAMRRALAMLALAPEQRLRVGGLVAAGLGVAIAWLLQGM